MRLSIPSCSRSGRSQSCHRWPVVVSLVHLAKLLPAAPALQRVHRSALALQLGAATAAPLQPAPALQVVAAAWTLQAVLHRRGADAPDRSYAAPVAAHR